MSADAALKKDETVDTEDTVETNTEAKKTKGRKKKDETAESPKVATVKYVGPKSRVSVPFPVGVKSLGAIDTTLQWRPKEEKDLPYEQGVKLASLDRNFKLVAMKGDDFEKHFKTLQSKIDEDFEKADDAFEKNQKNRQRIDKLKAQGRLNKGNDFAKEMGPVG